MTAAASRPEGTATAPGRGAGHTDTAGMAFGAPCNLKAARVPLNEASDDYPLIVARLNERWRVIESRCDLQWILQRRDAGYSGKWRGNAFCRTRDGLLERAGAGADSAMRIVERLSEWHRPDGAA